MIGRDWQRQLLWGMLVGLGTAGHRVTVMISGLGYRTLKVPVIL